MAKEIGKLQVELLDPELVALADKIVSVIEEGKQALAVSIIMNEIETIQSKIYEIRGQRIMLDFDLAMLYEVETRSLNQTVKRNARRFPNDFMFQLTEQEWDIISSQFVMTSRLKRPGKSLPSCRPERYKRGSSCTT